MQLIRLDDMNAVYGMERAPRCSFLPYIGMLGLHVEAHGTLPKTQVKHARHCMCTLPYLARLPWFMPCRLRPAARATGLAW